MTSRKAHCRLTTQDVTVTHASLSDNRATVSGGGMYVSWTPTGSAGPRGVDRASQSMMRIAIRTMSMAWPLLGTFVPLIPVPIVRERLRMHGDDVEIRDARIRHERATQKT